LGERGLGWKQDLAYKTMKNIATVFFCLLSGVVFSQQFTQMPCKNHLVNYDFNNGTSSWILSNVEATTESSVKNSFLRIDNSLNGRIGRVDQITHIPRAAFSVNISCWSKKGTDGSHPAYMYIYFLRGQEIVEHRLLSLSSGENWRLTSQRFDVPAGARKVEIGLSGPGNLFDNVCVAFSCQKTEPRPSI